MFVYSYRFEKLTLCVLVDSNDNKFGVLGNESLGSFGHHTEEGFGPLFADR